MPDLSTILTLITELGSFGLVAWMLVVQLPKLAKEKRLQTIAILSLERHVLIHGLTDVQGHIDDAEKMKILTRRYDECLEASKEAIDQIKAMK